MPSTVCGVTGAGLASAPTRSLPSTLPDTVFGAASSVMAAVSLPAVGASSTMATGRVPVPVLPPRSVTLSVIVSVELSAPGWSRAAFRV